MRYLKFSLETVPPIFWKRSERLREEIQRKYRRPSISTVVEYVSCRYRQLSNATVVEGARGNIFEIRLDGPTINSIPKYIRGPFLVTINGPLAKPVLKEISRTFSFLTMTVLSCHKVSL